MIIHLKRALSCSEFLVSVCGYTIVNYFNISDINGFCNITSVSYLFIHMVHGMYYVYTIQKGEILYIISFYSI